MTDSTSTELHAWYSERAAQISGTAIYALADGSEVEVTSVARTADDAFYQWEDKVALGPVSHYLRKGRRGSAEPIPRYFL